MVRYLWRPPRSDRQWSWRCLLFEQHSIDKAHCLHRINSTRLMSIINHAKSALLFQLLSEEVRGWTALAERYYSVLTRRSQSLPTCSAITVGGLAVLKNSLPPFHLNPELHLLGNPHTHAKCFAAHATQLSQLMLKGACVGMITAPKTLSITLHRLVSTRQWRANVISASLFYINGSKNFDSAFHSQGIWIMASLTNPERRLQVGISRGFISAVEDAR